MRFTGAHGLDLSLSARTGHRRGRQGTLYADVAGPPASRRGAKVPLVCSLPRSLATGRRPGEDLPRPCRDSPCAAPGHSARHVPGGHREWTRSPWPSPTPPTRNCPPCPTWAPLPTTSARPAARNRTTGPGTSADPVAGATDGGDFPALPVSLAAGALLLVASSALVAVAVRGHRAQPAASPPGARVNPRPPDAGRTHPDRPPRPHHSRRTESCPSGRRRSTALAAAVATDAALGATALATAGATTAHLGGRGPAQRTTS